MILRLVIAVTVVAVATMAGLVWQARQGRVRRTGTAGGGVASAVLFTTPTCRTCPQVRDNLATVARRHPGFSWHEVDAAKDLATARVHKVLRAPTIVFRALDGTEVSRASGMMGVPAILAAIGSTGTPVGSPA